MVVFYVWFWPEGHWNKEEEAQVKLTFFEQMTFFDVPNASGVAEVCDDIANGSIDEDWNPEVESKKYREERISHCW